MSELFISLSFIICIILLIYLVFFIQKLRKQLKIERQKAEKYESQNNLISKELEHTKKRLAILEEMEDQKILKESNNINYQQIFNEKRALIGNQHSFIANQTKELLLDFGIHSDIVGSSSEIIDRIKSGCVYDIIFTNNIYRSDMTGPEMLKKLKEIKGFNTYVVIHTISKGERENFLKLGFDEYIEKPVDTSKLEKVLIKLFKGEIYDKNNNS